MSTGKMSTFLKIMNCRLFQQYIQIMSILFAIALVLFFFGVFPIWVASMIGWAEIFMIVVEFILHKWIFPEL